jgi:hypothetical protein
MKLKKLPIGIQTFKKLRQEGCVYVDKTEIAYNLIERGSYYFLSRPRRFGKSLFLDTLSEIFKGSKELFEGLSIYDKWDWNKKYPVIAINFSQGSYRSEQNTYDSIKGILKGICRTFLIDFNEIERSNDNLGIIFAQLIALISQKYNEQVVILIDEYDKPILDNITNKEQAKINRDILASFYGTIKACDQYLRFVMLTGVTKFSKVNLFSNLNNLQDITVDKKYATITGYTQNDLEICFSDYLEGVNLEAVKKWYNGYNYFGEAIYNPFDILLFLSKNCQFENYWWETGNPSFLIELLKKSLDKVFIPELGNLIVTKETLNSFDVDHIELVALLWQTGYLTFAEEIIDDITYSIEYKLKIPNLEIQRSLNSLFLDYLTNLNGAKTAFSSATSKSLREGDLAALEDSLKSLFSAIPYANYANNIIADYEGYYASVMFTHIASIGYDLITRYLLFVLNQ